LRLVLERSVRLRQQIVFLAGSVGGGGHSKLGKGVDIVVVGSDVHSQ